MKKFIYPFVLAIVNFPVSVISFLGGIILVIWSFARRPHPVTLEEFGIRIVAPKDYLQSGEEGERADESEVYIALRMLKRFDRRQLELVKKHIRIIFLVPNDVKPARFSSYFRSGHVCLINLHSISPEVPAEKKFIAIAGLLAYQATLADFKSKMVFFGHRRAAVEVLCRRQKQRVLKKLDEELCEPS
jgi:hypothetical protein